MKTLYLTLTSFFFCNLGASANLQSLPTDVTHSFLSFLNPQELLTYRQTKKNASEHTQYIFSESSYRKNNLSLWSEKEGCFHPTPWQFGLFQKVLTSSQKIISNVGPENFSIEDANVILNQISTNIENEMMPFHAPLNGTNNSKRKNTSVYDKAAQTLVEITLQNLTRAYVLNTTLQYIPEHDISLLVDSEEAHSEWLNLLENESTALTSFIPHSRHMPEIPGRVYDQRFSHHDHSLTEGYTHSILLDGDNLALHAEIQAERTGEFRSFILLDKMKYADTFYNNLFQNAQDCHTHHMRPCIQLHILGQDLEDNELTKHIHRFFDLVNWETLREENHPDIATIYTKISLCASRLFQLKTLMFRATPQYQEMVKKVSKQLKTNFRQSLMEQWLEDFTPSHNLNHQNPLIKTRHALYKNAKNGISIWGSQYIP